MSSVPLSVTVIVPIYNVEKYIDKCIESLLSQTYNNIEIILVDDGSTDESGNIADQYAESYNNILVIHKENGGLSSARNAGIKIAKGQWIAFVDSDDYVRKDYVSKLLEIATNSDADVAVCNKEPVGFKKKKSFEWPSTVLSGREAIEERFYLQCSSQIWLYLFKAKTFRENDIYFPEGRNYESTTVIVKALYNANRVAFTNEKLYYYVNRKGSISHDKYSEKNCKDMLISAEDLNSFLDKTSTNFKYAPYYEYCIINSALNYMSRSHASRIYTKRIWQNTRKQLISLYPKVEFPSFKIKLKRSILLFLSCNQSLYYAIYNRLGSQ